MLQIATPSYCGQPRLMDHEPDLPPDTTRPSWAGIYWRVIVFAVLFLVAGALLVQFRGELSIDALAAREAQLHDFYQQHPIETLAIAFVVYVVVTGLSLPGALAMTVVYGWLFGFWPALVLVSFASTSGATIAFLTARYLYGQPLQARYGRQLAAFNAAIEREGAFYLFALRLIPQAPFFVINVVMGLTRLRARTFWWVSQTGMLPGTCVYVWAGASAPSLSEVAESGLSSFLDWKLMAALIALGLLPLAMKWLLSVLARPAARDAGKLEN